MPRSDGRGTHHVPRAGAIRGRRGAGMRGLTLAASLVIPLLAGAPALAQDDPAVQRGVPAEATAANAVQAKERALANAQRIAWGRYAAATGQNPNASAAQIESAVASMVVEAERSTLNGYSGRYTIRFRGARSPSAPPPVASGGSSGGLSGGASGGTETAGAVPPLAPPARPDPANAAFVPPPGPSAAGTLEAATSFRSFDEYLLLRRRLLAQPLIGSVTVVAISTEGARLRLGLRGAPDTVAAQLAGGGIVLVPGAAAPGAVPSSPSWRVGLAGGA